ncbi:lysis protein, partial [Serratia ureilytica]|nr:lysis protein [Serratia ureilytica]
MPEKIADSATHGGWLVGLLLGAINYFSPSEWMVIGIFVGILSSVIGCIVGIFASLIFSVMNALVKTISDAI